MSPPITLLIACGAATISYLIVYYITTAYEYLSTSWQIFEVYNYEKIAYWCILILSLLYITRSIYIHNYMSSGDFTLSDGLTIKIAIEAGCIIACIRRIRE